jgi:hypothetical protein
MTRTSESLARTRVPARLTPKLDKRLIAYTAAAAAAGIGLSSQSVEAKVVYTAANIQITNLGGVNLDLNHDGIADFTLVLGSAYGGRRFPEGAFASGLTIYPAQAANEVWGIKSAKGWECAAALPSGVKVGAGAAFQKGYLPLWQASGSYTRGATEHCPWDGLRRGAFLGLKFVIHGEAHYGWAHITVGKTTVLSGYAYETVPNQAIATGKTSGPASVAELNSVLPQSQPATLGTLAWGACGLEIWRRDEELVG